MSDPLSRVPKYSTGKVAVSRVYTNIRHGRIGPSILPLSREVTGIIL